MFKNYFYRTKISPLALLRSFSELSRNCTETPYGLARYLQPPRWKKVPAEMPYTPKRVPGLFESLHPYGGATFQFADNNTSVKVIYRWLHSGDLVLFTGSLRHATQTVTSLKKRMARRRPEKVKSSVDSSALLQRLCVPINPDDGRCLLKALNGGAVLQKSMSTLLKIPNDNSKVVAIPWASCQWEKEGIQIPLIDSFDSTGHKILGKGSLEITPTFSVFPPTRHDFSILFQCLLKTRSKWLRKLDHGSIYDVGTGTGILGLLLLNSGDVTKVICSDINPVAVDCAKSNFRKHGWKENENFESIIQNGISYNRENSQVPPQLVVCNPPWMKQQSKASDENINSSTRSFLDAAIFEPNCTALPCLLNSVLDEISVLFTNSKLNSNSNQIKNVQTSHIQQSGKAWIIYCEIPSYMKEGHHDENSVQSNPNPNLNPKSHITTIAKEKGMKCKLIAELDDEYENHAKTYNNSRNVQRSQYSRARVWSSNSGKLLTTTRIQRKNLFEGNLGKKRGKATNQNSEKYLQQIIRIFEISK